MAKQNGGGKAALVGASLAAIAAGAGYGTGGAVCQIVAGFGFDIGHIVVIEFLVGALVLGVLSCTKYRTWPTGKELVQLIGLGLASCFSSLCYFFAIDLLSVGQAVAVQFQYVWIAVLIQSVVERTRPGKWVVISTLAIIAGTLLGSGLVDEMLSSGSGLALDPLGFALAIGCAVVYGAYLYLNGRIAPRVPPVTRGFFIAVGGAIMAAAFAPGFFRGDCDIVALFPGGIAMGLIMCVIPLACLSQAAKRLPGGIVAILTSTELPVAVLAGCLMLGEKATPLTILGVVIITASIVLSEMDSLVRKKPGEDGAADAQAPVLGSR